MHAWQRPLLARGWHRVSLLCPRPSLPGSPRRYMMGLMRQTLVQTRDRPADRARWAWVQEAQPQLGAEQVQ